VELKGYTFTRIWVRYDGVSFADRGYRRYVTYFVQAERSGLIKIGQSLDVARRVKAIVGHLQQPAHILVTSTRLSEREAHKRFARFAVDRSTLDPQHYRVSPTEWFHPAPELIAFINGQRRRYRLPPVAERAA
jgi:hypothetical protein